MGIFTSSKSYKAESKPDTSYEQNITTNVSNPTSQTTFQNMYTACKEYLNLILKVYQTPNEGKLSILDGAIQFTENLANLPYTFVIYLLTNSIKDVLETRRYHKKQFETVEIHFYNKLILSKWSALSYYSQKITQEVKKKTNGLVLAATSTLSILSLFVTFVMNLGSVIYVSGESVDELVLYVRNQMQADQHYHVIWFNEQKVSYNVLEEFMYNGLYKISNQQEMAFLHANSNYYIQIITFKPQKHLVIDQFCSSSALQFLKYLKQVQFNQEVYISQYNLYPSHLLFLSPFYNIFMNKDLDKYVVKIEYCQIAQNLVVKTIKTTPIYKFQQDYFGKQYVNIDYYMQFDFLSNYKQFLTYLNGETNAEEDDFESPYHSRQQPTEYVMEVADEVDLNDKKKKKKKNKQKKNKAPQLVQQEQVTLDPTVPEDVAVQTSDQILNDYMFNPEDEVVYDLNQQEFSFVHQYVCTRDYDYNQSNLEYLVYYLQTQMNDGDKASCVCECGAAQIVVNRKWKRGY